MRMLKLLALLTTLTATAAVAAQADDGHRSGPAKPGFNLEAVLRPAAGGPDEGFGLVKFRQPKDENKIVYLDVWVRKLAPNGRYFLQRATDPTVDDDCTGTNWLTLGEGSMEKAITTNDRGTGRAALYRDLTAIPTGTQFDIAFRVVDAISSAVVLESGCYQFTVIQ